MVVSRSIKSRSSVGFLLVFCLTSVCFGEEHFLALVGVFATYTSASTTGKEVAVASQTIILYAVAHQVAEGRNEVFILISTILANILTSLHVNTDCVVRLSLREDGSGTDVSDYDAVY